MTELTDRQNEVFEMLAEGLLGKHIAVQLGVSTKNVEALCDRAIAALHAKNRAHAVLLWDRARRPNQPLPEPRPEFEKLFCTCDKCKGLGFTQREVLP